MTDQRRKRLGPEVVWKEACGWQFALSLETMSTHTLGHCRPVAIVIAASASGYSCHSSDFHVLSFKLRKVVVETKFYPGHIMTGFLVQKKWTLVWSFKLKNTEYVRVNKDLNRKSFFQHFWILYNSYGCVKQRTQMTSNRFYKKSLLFLQVQNHVPKIISCGWINLRET